MNYGHNLKRFFIDLVKYGFPTVAIILSILSYIDSRKANKFRGRLNEIEEKLKKYELEDKEKERQEANKACVEARIMNVARHKYNLRENLGIDVPDEVFALAPYLTEIILGIRLLLDLALVNRDFKKVQTTDKARLGAVKVLILFSRFGVNTILGIAGTSIETAVTPGVGTAIGGVSGVVVGSIINKKIAPYSLNIAYSLLRLNEEEIFYFKNMERIHNLDLEYRKYNLYLHQI